MSEVTDEFGLSVPIALVASAIRDHRQCLGRIAVGTLPLQTPTPWPYGAHG